MLKTGCFSFITHLGSGGELLRLVAKVHIVRNNSENATVPQSAGMPTAKGGQLAAGFQPGYLSAWLALLEWLESAAPGTATPTRLVICVCEICVQFFTLHFSLICQLATGSNCSSSPSPSRSHAKGSAHISDSGEENAHITYTQCCGLLVFFWERASTLQISRVTGGTYRGGRAGRAA